MKKRNERRKEPCRLPGNDSSVPPTFAQPLPRTFTPAQVRGGVRAAALLRHEEMEDIGSCQELWQKLKCVGLYSGQI